MSSRKANFYELHATSGGALLVSFGEPAWPDHVHFQFLGSTKIDLGNLYIKHYESQFIAWLADRNSLRAAVTIGDLSVACVAVFSPHQYVFYGSLSSTPYVLLVQDEKNSPVHTVAQLQLDPDTAVAWRRLLCE